VSCDCQTPDLLDKTHRDQERNIHAYTLVILTVVAWYVLHYRT
jgi:hypothetical protein